MNDEQEKIINNLSEREKKILHEKFGVDLETGEGLEKLKNLDVSVESIESITKEAIKKIKNK